jgi:hypothetical protein
MMASEKGETSREPTTTTQEDLVTAGQRKINLLWECTQALIAMGVTASYIWTQMMDVDSPGLANACFLIVGFYFSRTNHSAIGGIGPKPQDEYKGR